MDIIANHGFTLLLLAGAFGLFMAWGIGANDVATPRVRLVDVECHRVAEQVADVRDGELWHGRSQVERDVAHERIERELRDLTRDCHGDLLALLVHVALHRAEALREEQLLLLALLEHFRLQNLRLDRHKHVLAEKRLACLGHHRHEEDLLALLKE